MDKAGKRTLSNGLAPSRGRGGALRHFLRHGSLRIQKLGSLPPPEGSVTLHMNTTSHLMDPAGDPLHAWRYTSPAIPKSQLTSAGTSGIHSKNLQNLLSPVSIATVFLLDIQYFSD